MKYGQLHRWRLPRNAVKETKTRIMIPSFKFKDLHQLIHDGSITSPFHRHQCHWECELPNFITFIQCHVFLGLPPSLPPLQCPQRKPTLALGMHMHTKHSTFNNLNFSFSSKLTILCFLYENQFHNQMYSAFCFFIFEWGID